MAWVGFERAGIQQQVGGVMPWRGSLAVHGRAELRTPFAALLDNLVNVLPAPGPQARCLAFLMT